MTIVHDAFSLLLESTLSVGAAALVLLALRRPVRRVFGADAAYALWWLLPLAALAVAVPALTIESEAVAPQQFPAIVPVMDDASPSAANAMPAMAGAASASPHTFRTFDWRIGLLVLWGAGAAICALRFWRQQRRFWRLVGTPGPGSDGVLYAQSPHVGPALAGAWNGRIVLPSDFETRYSREQQALILAHERIHRRRRDGLVNLALTALRCVYWFNPLLHRAVASVRTDQELACDARVIGAHPNSCRAYAEAMFRTQLADPGLPVGCHWQSSQSLKERILMLKQPLVSSGRRRMGRAAVMLTVLACSFTAWALQPKSENHPPTYLGVVVPNPAAEKAIVAVATGNRSDYSYLAPGMPFRFLAGTADDLWELEAMAIGVAAAPQLTWTVTRAGRIVEHQAQPVALGGVDDPLRISLGVDNERGELPLSISFSQLPAEGPTTRFVPGDSGISLREDGQGVYRMEIDEPIRFPVEGLEAERQASLVLHVDTNGSVERIEIEGTEGEGEYRAVERMFDRMRFSPGMRSGVPVSSKVRVPMTFLPASGAEPVEPGEMLAVRVTPRTAARTVAQRGGIVLVNPEALSDERMIQFQFTDVPAEVALELIASEEGVTAVKEGQSVRFDRP